MLFGDLGDSKTLLNTKVYNLTTQGSGRPAALPREWNKGCLITSLGCKNILNIVFTFTDIDLFQMAKILFTATPQYINTA